MLSFDLEIGIVKWFFSQIFNAVKKEGKKGGG